MSSVTRNPCERRRCEGKHLVREVDTDHPMGSQTILERRQERPDSGADIEHVSRPRQVIDQLMRNTVK